MAQFPWRWRVRQVANVYNFSTPVGLLVAKLGRAHLRPGPQGLILAEGYRLKFPVAAAFTIGNVVITQFTAEQLEAWTPGVLEHEARHSWQYAFCLGAPFLPLYVMAMGWSWLRTGDRAARNIFEQTAGLDRGGYRKVPVRPVRQAFRRQR